MGEDHIPEVTEVVRSEIRQGHEKRFDEWFKRFSDLQKKTSGYLGITVLAPQRGDSNLRYVITRFKDVSSLENWRESEDRKKLVEEVRTFSIPHYERATGLETWFAVPESDSTSPPRWKMSIVIFFAAYIISASAFTILGPIVVSLPFLLSNVLITGILVVGLTYLALPALTRLAKRWLYPNL